jgi:RNA polymerase sigma factor (sigma-70 family)
MPGGSIHDPTVVERRWPAGDRAHAPSDTLARVPAMHPKTMGTAELVDAAMEGDTAAWDALVGRFAGVVWAVCRSNRLTDADAADVFQTTWLRLIEHGQALRDRARVGGWLATTAARECSALRRKRSREMPIGEEFDALPGAGPRPGAQLLTEQRADALWAAFGTLPERCQRLLRVLAADPPPSYEDVCDVLGMKIGSIGPTRGRCLEHLRRALVARGVESGDDTLDDGVG